MTTMPTGWRIEEGMDDDTYTDVMHGHNLIAQCVGIKRYANAAHIVRCVNEREGLLDLIRTVVVSLKTVYMGLPANQFPGPPTALVAKLEAVLAQAEQEAPP